MKYQDQNTREISFPLGGIGAGCIGLSGTGHFIDWEIFNAPNKGSLNGVSHFAVRLEQQGKVRDFRLLHGPVNKDFSGGFSGSREDIFTGFGYGPFGGLMAGWEHFEKCTFTGEFPFAELQLEDSTFPCGTKLKAWSPFTPGDSLTSSLPCACFEITLTNPTAEPFDGTVIGVLSNPWHQGKNRLEKNRVFLSGEADEFNAGDLSLAALEDPENCSGQEYFYRGNWFDDLEMYHQNVMAGGRFRNRHYTGPHPLGERKKDSSLLAVHFTLAPGETRTVSYCLTWSVPLRRNTWDPDAETCGIPNRWKNFYATVWENSAASMDHLLTHYEEIRRRTQQFHDALFATTLPPAMMDGISANLSVLKTPTCLRLEDGTFWGWEGCAVAKGSCEGSCQHVWNYAQALPFLFPDLERSMRESHLNYSLTASGASKFRVSLPLGRHAEGTVFRACADGQFGEIMKFYRDWKISGDDAWLKKYWNSLKSMLSYAWSPENPDRWDPDQSGILTGRQHHTLDMELFGANSWLTSHYLGALLAMAQMAETMEEPEFASFCRSLFAKGKAYCETHLFNGEYFHQQTELSDHAMLEPYENAEHYWNEEIGELKYQIGSGLGIDAVLGDYYARLYGIGTVFDPAKTRSTLEAIYRHNFVREVGRLFNSWRCFSLNDESGVMICTWPKGGKSAIPVPYNSETMHGFEWTFAAHLTCFGMMEKAEEIASSIRSRYDGARRNPWNEIECGSNYARSMAAYGLLCSSSGFTFDRGAGKLGFAPVVQSPYCTFWSIGSAWGTVSIGADQAELTVLYGELDLQNLSLPFGEFSGIGKLCAGETRLFQQKK